MFSWGYIEFKAHTGHLGGDVQENWGEKLFSNWRWRSRECKERAGRVTSRLGLKAHISLINLFNEKIIYFWI